VVTHQLQVERRTAKAHRPKTNALPLVHATNRGDCCDCTQLMTLLPNGWRHKWLVNALDNNEA